MEVRTSKRRSQSGRELSFGMQVEDTDWTPREVQITLSELDSREGRAGEEKEDKEEEEKRERRRGEKEGEGETEGEGGVGEETVMGNSKLK